MMAQYVDNIRKYKAMSRNRIRKSPVMKIPLSELDRDKVDRVTEHKITYYKSSFKVQDREVAEIGPVNPFHLPPRDKILPGKEFSRKVKKEPFIMSDPKTICDIDPTFYKIIEGRPIRQFVDVKVYMRDIRNIALTKSNIAYLRDQMIQIGTSYSVELEEYEKINKLCIKTKNNFVQFAKECYMFAQKLQEQSEKKANELQALAERLEICGFQFVKIRNEISNLGATYDILHLYYRFLTNVAPLSWRKLNDKEYNKKSSCHFSEQNLVSADELTTDMYIKRYDLKSPRPKLYFQEPETLMHVFDRLSAQCLTYMQIDTFSSQISSSVIKRRDYLKHLAAQEIEEYQFQIANYAKELEWMKEQEIIHKNLFENLLNTAFYELYASYDSSKLFTCVQYVHMQIFGDPEDPKDSAAYLAQQLENLYVEITLGMDSLDVEVVKEATTELFAEDIRNMKMAELAQRQLRECNILSKALFTSFEPPRQQKRRKKEKTTRESNTEL
ncbi:uncharacterized protein [Choristoneura fumiferana]|uniref:uncharacterized protein n=1 Tax=Choristoneura fumiferana TaxID=7141 RepID=UPI003D1584B0